MVIVYLAGAVLYVYVTCAVIVRLMSLGMLVSCYGLRDCVALHVRCYVIADALVGQAIFGNGH